MANATLQVLIDIQSKLAGLELAVAQMKQLKDETAAAAAAGQGGFAQLFKIGESIDLTRRLNDAIAEVPGKLLEWTKEGVRFNAQMETSRIAIAAALRQFDSGNFPTFQSGLEKSGELIDLLREKANQFGLSFEGVLHQYQTTATALFRAGIKDLQQQVDITILLQRALASLPLNEAQKQRDIIDILIGQAKRTEAGRALGIDDQALERATEKGQFVVELTRQLKGFLEAGDASANTFNATLNRLENNILRLKQVATADTTSGLKRSLDDVNEAISSPRAVGSAQALGIWFGNAIEGAQALVSSVLPAVKSTTDAIAILNKASENEPQTLPGLALVAIAQQTLEAENKRVQTLVTEADAIQKQESAYKANLAAAQTLKEIQAATAAGVQTLADKDNLRAKIQAEINRLKQDDNQFSRDLVNVLQIADENLDRAKTAAQGLSQVLAVAGGILKSMGADAENLGNKITDAIAKVNRELNLGSALGPAGRVQQLQSQQVEDLNRARQLANEITGSQTAAFNNVKELGEFIRTLDKPDTTALVGPRTKADVEEIIKLYEQLAHGQLTIKAGVEAENSERKKVADNVTDYNNKLRQAQIDGEKFRGEDTTAAQHALDIDTKRAELTDSHRAALEAGRVTQDEINALADAEVANDERDKQLTIDKKNAKLGERDAQKEINAFLREESNLLASIHQRQQLVDANIRLTPDQKNAETIANTVQEIDLLNQKVAQGRALLAGGALDPATYQQVDGRVQKTASEVALLNEQLDKLNHPIFASLSGWVNQLGTAMQQVGGLITSSITTALDGAANVLTDLVFATGNWRQTFLQAEKAIVGSMIKIGLQMIAQKVLGTILGRQGAQETTQNNAQVLATATPAAVAQSGASSGFNWVFAGIAAAAAIALIIGLLAGGFEKGGHTGFGGRAAIAGIVHGQEYVHPKDTVDYYGLPFMAALHQRRIPATRVQELIGNYRHAPTPRFGSFEVGGAVAAITAAGSNESSRAGAGEVKLNNYLVMDEAELRKRLLNDDFTEAFITRLNGNVHRIRKRS